MIDSYKEGYDKGYQDGRLAGVTEVVKWIESHWVESKVCSDVKLTWHHWKDSPEIPFGWPPYKPDR